MVELRKRPPPKEPLTSAPPAKKAAAATVPTGKGRGRPRSAPKADAVAAETPTVTEPPPAPVPTAAVPVTTTTTTAPPAKAGRGRPKTKGALAPDPVSAAAAAVVQETTSAPAPISDPPITDTAMSEAAPDPATIPAPAAEAIAHPATSIPTKGPAVADDGPKTGGKFGAGTKIPLDVAEVIFGGTVQTNDGVDTTLNELLKKSQAGIVVFTYPKASTPGCTTQACLFRDSYKPISDASYSVYGLSTDSPKSNTTFVTKHSLPYPLLCDPVATLTSAIGMKKPGAGKSTSRGVVVIDKDGTVRLWEQAGPQKTLDVVLEFIKTKGPSSTAPAVESAPAPAPAIRPLSAVPAGLKAMDDGPYADAPSPYIKSPDTKMMEAPLVRTPSMAEQEAADTALEVSEVAKRLDGTPNSHSIS